MLSGYSTWELNRYTLVPRIIGLSYMVLISTIFLSTLISYRIYIEDWVSKYIFTHQGLSPPPPSPSSLESHYSIHDITVTYQWWIGRIIYYLRQIHRRYWGLFCHLSFLLPAVKSIHDYYLRYISVKQDLCLCQVLLCISQLDIDLYISWSLLIAILTNNGD